MCFWTCGSMTRCDQADSVAHIRCEIPRFAVTGDSEQISGQPDLG